MGQAVSTWKPMGKYAAMMEEPVEAWTPPPAPVTHDWGFGARGVTKMWTPPQEKPVPTDWWKK